MSGTLSLSGNPFYTPWFLAASRHLPGGQHDFLDTVPGLPLRRMPWPFAPAYGALITPYAPLTLPRVGLEAMAHALAASPLRFLRLAMLPGDESGRHLLESLTATGARVTELSRHERACLATDLGSQAYLAQAMSQKRRKRAREARNRLARTGEVRFSSAATPAERLSFLEIFRTLEAGGWKGRGGTAFAAQDGPNLFLQHLVAAAPPDALGLHLLHAEDKPVAAGIVLHDADAAWFWKTAYDEAHAHASPGVVFTLELTRHLVDERGIRMIDSCADADHPMINGIWAERMPILDVLVDLKPSGPALLPPVLAGALAAKRQAKRLLKRSHGHQG